MDDRADATSIAQLFLGLGVGAVVYWIVSLVASPLLDKAGAASNDQVANQGTAWMSAGIDFFPIFILFLSFFGLIAYSVYRREVVR